MTIHPVPVCCWGVAHRDTPIERSRDVEPFLWLNPACVAAGQDTLFGGAA